MKVRYEKKKEEKKKLIAAICEITGVISRYMGPPTMSYCIGELEVDREGNLNVPDGMDVTELIGKLKDQGYEGEVEMTVQINAEQGVTSLPLAPAENTGFSISLPKDHIPEEAMERLERLLEAKGKLIRKALGVVDLKITQDEGKITFPWFDRIPEADQVESYTRFIAAMAKMAKEQSRISCKERENKNEKYAFRCFLLRLGFIGDEFKKDRRILLKNFDGSSAFSTQEAADRAKEKQAAKRAEQEAVE